MPLFALFHASFIYILGSKDALAYVEVSTEPSAAGVMNGSKTYFHFVDNPILSPCIRLSSLRFWSKLSLRVICFIMAPSEKQIEGNCIDQCLCLSVCVCIFIYIYKFDLDAAVWVSSGTFPFLSCIYCYLFLPNPANCKLKKRQSRLCIHLSNMSSWH